MVRAPAEYPKRSACKKSLWRSNKKICEKNTGGGHPISLHRVIERDFIKVNSMNSTTNDAVIKAQNRENYQHNIVSRVKAQAIEGLCSSSWFRIRIRILIVISGRLAEAGTTSKSTHNDDDDDKYSAIRQALLYINFERILIWVV